MLLASELKTVHSKHERETVLDIKGPFREMRSSNQREFLLLSVCLQFEESPLFKYSELVQSALQN